MGTAVIACADVATAKMKPATAINLIIIFLRLSNVWNENNQPPLLDSSQLGFRFSL
jgi:hypothetical protein